MKVIHVATIDPCYRDDNGAEQILSSEELKEMMSFMEDSVLKDLNNPKVKSTPWRRQATGDLIEKLFYLENDDQS